MELTVRSCILWEPQKQQTPVQVRWVEDEPPGPKSSCKAKQKWDFVERLTKLPNDFSFKDIRFFQPFSPFENLFRSLKLFYIINCVIKLNSCKDLQRLQKSKKGFEKLKKIFDFLNFLLGTDFTLETSFLLSKGTILLSLLPLFQLANTTSEHPFPIIGCISESRSQGKNFPSTKKSYSNLTPSLLSFLEGIFRTMP